MEDALDHAVWTALITRQSGFALGQQGARRFRPDVAPFAAARDDSPESLAALGDLMADGETDVYLLQRTEIVLPATLTAPMTAPGVQMVKRRAGDAPALREEIVRLTAANIPDMRALIDLTRPGPFRARTVELGDYFGIRVGGRLAAMAGERLKLPGFTEVSAVCTHPDFRGRGFGAALTVFAGRRIEARGETPFLHTYASNAGAIRLYEKLGYEVRCGVHVAVLAKPAQDA
ncbi:GNAT family N-acetyltransferase [Polymorphum gilvum]|uniref:Putative acetyltransferase protein, GNAT family protein n=1 Tax=Polymorphum gilvum (strain LMG 25793 / CGMCC 1.9160 / SL003B-26A1) TaxID=991905 RepID=F2J1D7_POLGS|nr:GNAT family N-acetyltransferase [Polymorphum gilvum]ADZ69719.1 Putative acetyltransferase protein, GNAT family protein [Polymorphum gilvum SL003B-26A1]